jgi:hypothetical protein
MLPLAIALFAPVAVQDAADVSRTVDRLTECRAIAADADRLACFDRLAGRIAAARTSGDLLVLDRRQVVERKRRSFGLANPTSEMFGGGEADRATEVTQLDTTIRTAKPAAAYGRWNLELANGSVWQTVDTLSFPPKASAPITLKTATLGGYRASINKGRTFLVKRLR